MTTYYDILGLSASAGSVEIKTAFRRLAKLYHPDKNPTGKEHFTKILKAYEVLSDPIQKSTYDYRLKYQSINSSVDFETPAKATKNWRFDEKELKRRQYYNDYIKKQTQEAEKYQTVPEEKKRYSDYKYMFFATPLAVALFLLIMHAATTQRPSQPVIKAAANVSADSATYAHFKTGSELYTDFFGTQQHDASQKHKLALKNNTNVDVIVCLFSGEKFLRCVFVEKDDGIDLTDLPSEKVQLKFSSGLNFDPSKKIRNIKAKGIFTERFHFYKGINTIKLKPEAELALKADGTFFKEITEREFFLTE